MQIQPFPFLNQQIVEQIFASGQLTRDDRKFGYKPRPFRTTLCYSVSGRKQPARIKDTPK